MENSSLLSFTNGLGEIYHVELFCERKGVRETLCILISLSTMSIHLAGWTINDVEPMLSRGKDS